MTVPSSTTAKGVTPGYKRIVLKLSGEFLKGTGANPDTISAKSLATIIAQVQMARERKIEVVIVIGGGNIHRGLTGARKQAMNRSTSDYMGMLATVINGLGILDALEKYDIPVRLQSAVPMPQIAEPFILRRAIRHLEKGRVVIFVAGIGNSRFSTDTTAALRASEIGADAIFKATNVDGIYTSDPKRDPDAQRYETLNYMDALKERLGVLDSTAFSLCMDNDMPIIVYNIDDPTCLLRILNGENVGTRVGHEPTKLAPRQIVPMTPAVTSAGLSPTAAVA